jgi:hypothetical protein
MASIGLVLVCGAAAAMAAIAELSTCFAQTGDSSPPGTKVSAVCGSSGSQAAFNAGLVIAAVIGLVGVSTGYLSGNRRRAIIVTWASLGLVAILVIWGFATKTTISGFVGPA